MLLTPSKREPIFDESIELNGTILGHRRIPAAILAGQEVVPPSWVYFCPSCGQVWARIERKGPDISRWCCGNWQVLSRSCLPCGEAQSFVVAGSLLSHDPFLTEETIPPYLFPYELEAHLTHLSRHGANQ